MEGTTQEGKTKVRFQVDIKEAFLTITSYVISPLITVAFPEASGEIDGLLHYFDYYTEL